MFMTPEFQEAKIQELRRQALIKAGGKEKVQSDLRSVGLDYDEIISRTKVKPSKEREEHTSADYVGRSGNLIYRGNPFYFVYKKGSDVVIRPKSERPRCPPGRYLLERGDFFKSFKTDVEDIAKIGEITIPKEKIAENKFKIGKYNINNKHLFCSFFCKLKEIHDIISNNTIKNIDKNIEEYYAISLPIELIEVIYSYQDTFLKILQIKALCNLSRISIIEVGKNSNVYEVHHPYLDSTFLKGCSSEEKLALQKIESEFNKEFYNFLWIYMHAFERKDIYIIMNFMLFHIFYLIEKNKLTFERAVTLFEEKNLVLRTHRNATEIKLTILRNREHIESIKKNAEPYIENLIKKMI